MKKMVFPSYTCAICKLEFQFEGLKYSKNGKRIICLNCYDRITKADNLAVKTESEKKKKDKIQQPAASESIGVICMDCNYKFSLKKPSKIKLMCPYCGKNRLVRDNTTADEMIKEVSQKDTY